MKRYRFLLNTPDDPLPKGPWELKEINAKRTFVCAENSIIVETFCESLGEAEQLARAIAPLRQAYEALWKRMVKEAYEMDCETTYNTITLTNSCDFLDEDLKILLSAGVVVEEEVP